MNHFFLLGRRHVLVLTAIMIAALRPTEATPAAAGQGQPRSVGSGNGKAELRQGLSSFIAGQEDTEDTRSNAIAPLTRSANRGNASARFHLAHLYWSPGDLSNDQKARKLFLAVAKTGDPYAAANIGTFLHQGIAGPVDLASARIWYERAAKGGLANPAWRLAWMFEHATGVRRDLVEAYKWLDIAAKLAPLAMEPQESSGAAARRDELAARMSTNEISSAQRRSDRWMAARASSACQTQPDRIRLAVTIDDSRDTLLSPWLHRFEDQLKQRLTFPPCSQTESRAVMTFRAFKNSRAPNVDVRASSPLLYFDSAVYAALRQMQTEPLPAAFPHESVQLVVRVFYNEMP
jgi:hypothetical protein